MGEGGEWVGKGGGGWTVKKKKEREREVRRDWLKQIERKKQK